ncbi:mitochondrial fission ELM1 family protein [Phenylobacterium hankyongense]|nr:mitochondrial fission ELM1 family protein [Phenylobacterium hankyongense]
MRTQARALAMAVTDDVTEKVVRLRGLWRRAPAGFPMLLSGLDPADALQPPWPDLIVSCGRRAAAVAIAVNKKASGQICLVHVQDPQTNPRCFDLVVAMGHDRVNGPNVLRVPTALHDVTQEGLASAAREWGSRFEFLPRPFLGVLLGGSTARTRFTVEHADRLRERLMALQREFGGAVLVVPSRRTPEDVVRHFEDAATEGGPLWAWTGAGENPYRGVLALSDRLVVTADSISMISEALATPHPVELFMIELGARHTRFVDDLTRRKLVAPLTEESGAESRAAVYSTPIAAAATMNVLSNRLARAN